jgi:HAD superfamily hydrolase (TIGR01509 family)
MKVNALITDVSKVLLFPKDKTYQGSLNALYKENSSRDDFKFFDYFELNTELLDYYKSLKPSLDVYILTSDIIQDASDLQPHWGGVIDRIFSASKTNTHKSEPEAYEKVLSELDLLPEEVLYIDDNTDNIQASLSVGLNSVQYENNKQIFESINSLLKND